MKRRDFLKYMGAVGAMIGTVRRTNAGHRPPDVDIRLIARTGYSQVRPGPRTPVMHFVASVRRGDRASVQDWPSSYLGPILRFRKGQSVRVHFENQCGEPSIVHWHGLRVPAAMDGHPRTVVPSGSGYDYAFEVRNRAATYWYHPHPHGRTGPQIYYGLAGPLIVTDGEEQALDLPRGPEDQVLVVQDRILDADNRFVYGGGMMQRMMGFFGNEVLINGQADFTLSVTRKPHRLRVINASNARTYKLGWSDGAPLTVIGTDGGLLERPTTRPYVMLAPAERIELWADFSRYPSGTQLFLHSLPFTADVPMRGMGGGMMSGGMMDGMMGGMRRRMMTGSNRDIPNGAPLQLCRIRIEGPDHMAKELPTHLVPLRGYDIAGAINWRHPRVIRPTMAMMRWGLNGRTFEMNAVARDERVRLGTLEVWEFANDRGMGMMGPMAHPMHLHGVQFQVLSREIAPGFEEAYATIRDGLVDDGWKDTVLVSPGERVRILVKFNDAPGLFVYHCHNLEHADGGMMRNYRVEPA